MSDILNGLPLVGLISESAEKMLKERNDKRAIDKLVLGFMREAFCYSKKCARGKLPDDEIFSLSYKALNAAARKFDPARGRFFIFAKIYLRWEIKHAWAEKSVVRNAGGPDTCLHDHCEAEDILNEREETIVPEYDHPLDPLESPHSHFDFERVEFNERMAQILPLLRQLNPNERMVIEMRFRTGWDFAKIGREIGRSRERVRQIALEAIEKVKARIAA